MQLVANGESSRFRPAGNVWSRKISGLTKGARNKAEFYAANWRREVKNPLSP